VLVVPLLALGLATIFDFWKRQIPDSIPIALFGWAVGTTALGMASPGWLSLALGAGLGFSIGAFLFWLGGFGGGDAKLLGAVGAALGIRALLPFLLYAAIAGGLLAVIAILRGKRDLAYAPAMALGLFALMMSRGLR
jgi:prepilin peptidase CpaA